MIHGYRARPTAGAVRCAIAAFVVVGGALAGAASSAADPMTPNPPQIPSDPAAVPPGQLVVTSGDPAAPPAPPPTGPPSVPEIPNPNYGSGSGPLATLKDLWHQAQNPYATPDGSGSPGGALAPPPGAGPAPPLPPGYVSTNAPGSETQATSTGPGGGPAAGGPPLPPGYYSVNGPPPPGYEYAPVTAPGTPPTTAPATPTP